MTASGCCLACTILVADTTLLGTATASGKRAQNFACSMSATDTATLRNIWFNPKRHKSPDSSFLSKWSRTKKPHNLHAVQGPLDPPTDPYDNKETVSNNTISAEHLGQRTSNKRIIATSLLRVPTLRLFILLPFVTPVWMPFGSCYTLQKILSKNTISDEH